MTVSSTTARQTYIGDGSLATYSYNFRILLASHLVLVKRNTSTGAETAMVYGVDYTVTGAGSYSGGTFTLTAGVLPTGYTLAAYRLLDLLQSTDLRNQGSYFAEIHELVFDRLLMIDQQAQDQINRALRLPSSESTALLLPTKEQRALKSLSFDVNGDPTASASPSSGTISSPMQPVTSSASLAAARSALGTNGLLTISVKDHPYLAIGDGTTDDRASITAADAAAGSTGEIYFPAGTYKISSNLTISAGVRFAKGAKLSIPTGVTVTFNGTVDAGLWQIFALSGTGAVVLSIPRVPIGRPEWWGAVTGGTDCTAAINACIAACAVTEFQAGDYYISSPIIVAAFNKTLRGQGCLISRLVQTTSGADGIQIYKAATQLNTIFVDRIGITRNQAPAGSAKGIYVNNAAHVQITSVSCEEHVYGFYATGTNNLRIHKSRYVSQVYNGVGGDSMFGVYLECTLPNASVQIRDTDIIFLSYAGTSYGCYITNGQTKDIFLDAFETANASYGVYANGSATNNFDLHFHRCIHDGYKIKAVYLSGFVTDGNVSIVGGWHNPGVVGASHGVHVYNSRGVSINGAEFFGGGNYAAQIGVCFDSSQSCLVSGCTFRENNNAVKLIGGNMHAVNGNTMSNGAGHTAAAVVSLVGSSRNSICGNAIDGPATVGISLDATSGYNAVGINVINPGSVTTPTSNAGTGNVLTGNVN